MAIRMRAWLALVVGACAAVAITLLPPDRFEFPTPDEAPEQLRYDEALRELRRTHMMLQLSRWSDSLSALVQTGSGVEETRSGIRLAAFLQPVFHGALPGLPIGIPTWSSLTRTDMDGATPFCLTVHASPGGPQFDAEAVPLAALPDPCRVIDRFGAPGAHVEAWLERGAWGFGSSRVPVPDHLRLRDHSYAELPYFGDRRHPLARENVFVGACLAGRPDACARAVLDPVDVEGNGSELRSVAARVGWSYADLDWSDESPFRYLDDSLFADLERQFGEEAFTMFWSSDEEVPVAFEAAFGVELGDWVLTWADTQTGVSRAGPGLSFADIMLVIVTVGALTAMASGVGMRRRLA
jgi:hypothetical protein